MNDLHHVSEKPKRNLWLLILIGIAWLGVGSTCIGVWG